MQSNIIITARGVGQKIGSILAKHREDLGASMVLAPIIAPGGEAQANVVRAAARTANQANRDFLSLSHITQEPHQHFHYKGTKQSIVSVMIN